ncbi:Uncharacterized conserved protein YcbK, DUF882 family [Vibrio xiamenensis]|uniref:Murein endopeptidase K n=1 Tax=Vibrio xiamenensis TaxID=861298 RepID=A0A1G7ZQC5_9VIBR|nr:YcbK family protein [Vibrio xiamenensis]SDH10904.1 Uncharacterized conserved protein YcbK, DUF882 family [Vibrio xiamenensis]
MQLSRRKFLQLSTGGLVLSAFPSIALASPATKARTLVLNNLHTGESLETCYFDGRSYDHSELNKLNHLCRDFRRNEVFAMDKRLFDQIARIREVLGTQAEVEIISGYRSPATNEMLRNRSSGVAKKSYHMTGQAIDFRLKGVSLKKVRNAARSIRAGGVGYYPSSNFVHIDTGPVRYWS